MKFLKAISIWWRPYIYGTALIKTNPAHRVHVRICRKTGKMQHRFLYIWVDMGEGDNPREFKKTKKPYWIQK